jgi:hypothetical protein
MIDFVAAVSPHTNLDYSYPSATLVQEEPPTLELMGGLRASRAYPLASTATIATA